MPLTHPEQLWVAELLHPYAARDTLLHLVTDAIQSNRTILSRDLKAESTLKAYQMALRRECIPHQIIIFDRGLQSVQVYINELRNTTVKSMTPKMAIL